MHNPTSNQRFLPNYCMIKTDLDTAMIVLESGPVPDPQMLPRIHRYYISEHHGIAIDHGQVFGPGNGTGHALIVKTSPLCLIQVVEWRPDLGHMAGTIHQIGPEFGVVLLHSQEREMSRAEIETILCSRQTNGTCSLTLNDGDLRVFFASIQPRWLHEIIRAQLAHWRIHHVELFFKFTSEEPDQHDIRHCVKAAPFWALARWKGRLTPYQLKTCIRNSPRGAVCFATEQIPRYLRSQHLEKFAADALIHASAKLTAGELLRLATQEPVTALTPACRRQLPPRFRARLLARNHRRILTLETTEPIQDLKRDILASIAQFPAEWLLAHRGNFNNVFGALASGLKIKPQPSELTEMLDRMEPPYQQDFGRYIALMM
jgi:hypothetical protein